MVNLELKGRGIVLWVGIQKVKNVEAKYQVWEGNDTLFLFYETIKVIETMKVKCENDSVIVTLFCTN